MSFSGETDVTIELKTVSCGTEVKIRQVGIPNVIPPDVIPVESFYLGWQESLRQLALLVEADFASL